MTWEVPVGHLWSGGQKTEWGRRGTVTTGKASEHLLCMPELGRRVGARALHVTYVAWTLAGLRCLKPLRWWDTSPELPAQPSQGSRGLAKNASAKG